MGQAKYLIDTNAVIDYLGHKLPLSGIAFLNEANLENSIGIDIPTEVTLNLSYAFFSIAGANLE